ncbi:MAG: hypothetical protein IKT32_03625 [Clostridia bacterium]|nr:hypothetical protein [Clostridia bacterium]
MKKLFIFVVLIVVLGFGSLAYKNVDKPPLNDNPSIEQPDNNKDPSQIPGFDIENKPEAEGVELDKGYIYF